MCYPVCELEHIEDLLLLIRKSSNDVVAVGFFSCFTNVRCHRTIKKCVECIIK